jgi:hypothetical protein
MRLKIALLLMLILLPCLVAITPIEGVYVPPQVNVYLEPQNILDTSLIPGTQFTVDMTLDYIEPELLWAYQICLTFNASVMHGVSIENGPFMESNGGNVLVVEGKGFNNDAGTLGIFAAYLSELEKFPTGGSDEFGPLCTITFEVVDYGGSHITMGAGFPVGETRLANKTGGSLIDKKYHPERFFDSYFDNRPRVIVDPAEVLKMPVGRSFNISVNVAGMVDLYRCEFYMNWSAPLLDVTNVYEGDFFKSIPGGTQFVYEIHNDEGYIHVISERTLAPGVTGDGTIAQISFLVEDLGDSDLHLYDITLLDSASNPIIYMAFDGFFDNFVIHDIAVTSVTASPSMIEAGHEDLVSINVTVENIGDFADTFNVTIHYVTKDDEGEIDEATDITLDSGAKITLTFNWDVTDLEGGVYDIKAEASAVADEVNIENNIRIYKSVIVILHNISIITASTTSTRVRNGDSVHIDIAIENKGSMTESFNVTTYINGTAIQTKTMDDFKHGEVRSFTVLWNITTDTKPGLYLIMAETSEVPDDVDTSDNVFPIAVVEVLEVSEVSLSQQVMPIAVVAVVIVGISAAVIVFRRIRGPSAEAW